MTRVNRVFPAVPDGIRQWSQYLSKLFFAREFTTTLLGCTTEPTGTVRYTVSAGIVCLTLPELLATSNSVNAYLSDLPDEITPIRDQGGIARIVNNGVTAVGQVHIGTDTGITLYSDLDGNAFTSSGQKGVKGSVIVYSLD